MKKSPPIVLPLRDRLLAVALVVLVHVALLWSWAALPNLPKPVHHEMSVSLLTPDPPQSVVKFKPVTAQRVQAMPLFVPDSVPVEMPVMASQEPAQAVPAPPVNTAPASSDREPDYQAAYLHNPIPSYPMVARRMGWQGRVVLNVEVLASGFPGQIRVQQSSGYEVLDNAALQAVQGWRFVAARQGGQVVTKWFLVPIPFILKEAE